MGTSASPEGPRQPDDHQPLTLVQLLVVVVVLGILAAIAIPQFANPKPRDLVSIMNRQLRGIASWQSTYYSSRDSFASSVFALDSAIVFDSVFAFDTAVTYWQKVPKGVIVVAGSKTNWSAVVTHAKTNLWCGISGDTFGPASPACSADTLLATVQPLNSVDSAIQRLPWAGSAFTAPERMVRDRTMILAFVLDPAQPPHVSNLGVKLPAAQAESLIATVVQVAGPDVPAATLPIRYTSRMVAWLQGQAFEITPADEQVQAVSRTEATVWTWEVTPRRRGRQILQLTVDALLDIDGHETPRRFRVLRKEISVRVHWPHAVAAFVGNNWQWFLGGGGVLTSGTFLAWWRRRRRPKRRYPGMD